MYSIYKKWRTSNLRSEDGVLIGSDQTQEWLLPWWYHHFRKWCNLPIAIVDFGMTAAMKAWCSARGELIRLPVADIFVKEKDEIEAPLIADWETNFGNKFWDCRKAWFKKPLAYLQTPFQRTIWLDIDCEVRGALEPLLDACGHASGIGLVRERAEEVVYNSGVVPYLRNLPLIEEWAEASFEQNHAFRGDQELLSHMIAQKKLAVAELPPKYNWSRCYEENAEAVILHWHGAFGRSVIRHAMQEIDYENLNRPS